MDPNIIYALFGGTAFLVLLSIISVLILLKDMRKVNHRLAKIEDSVRNISGRRPPSSSRKREK